MKKNLVIRKMLVMFLALVMLLPLAPANVKADEDMRTTHQSVELNFDIPRLTAGMKAGDVLPDKDDMELIVDGTRMMGKDAPAGIGMVEFCYDRENNVLEDAVLKAGEVIILHIDLWANDDYRFAFERNEETETYQGEILLNGKPEPGFGFEDWQVILDIPLTVKNSQTVELTKTSHSAKAGALKKSAKGFDLKKSTKADTEVTFAKVDDKANSKYLSVTAAGKLKVKKNTPKGTYKLKIKITAAESDEYEEAAATKTVTVKVK